MPSKFRWLLVQIYLWSYDSQKRILKDILNFVGIYMKPLKHVMTRISNAINMLFIGICLGLFDRETLHQIDEEYYRRNALYIDNKHNRGGLFVWERTAIEAHFQTCNRLLLIGAGGGREYIALVRMGYRVDGVECHPKLVEYANGLLAAEGLAAEIQLVPRDSMPRGDGSYDGAIIGWSAYMLIQGRRRRIGFLRDLRARMKPDSPLLLSFFTRPAKKRFFKIVLRIANMFRGLLSRDPREVGDSLEPNYVHFFTEPELTAELMEAGFHICHFSTRIYGHAVAKARP